MTELQLFWRVFVRRWWLMLIPVGIVALVAVPDLLASNQPAAGKFEATFQYSAAQESSNLPQRDGDFQDVWLASEFVVNAFTDWVRSSSFRAELADELAGGVDLTGLEVIADNRRSIGVVIMRHPDDTALNAIAEAAITVLQTRNQAYFPHLGSEPAQVTIIDEPLAYRLPPALGDRFTPILQLALAAFAGLALGVIVEYLDPTLRTRDELEAQGVRVVATIPRR